MANIYGVDIDTQAVEVTKLSLLLKVLEGESAELINNTLKLYKERALPDLESNIKCGNSLIGPDFYTDKDMALFDMDTRLKINTFDWKVGFPDVMKAGGFDAVIGNPPYVLMQTLNEPASFEYLSSYFKTAKYKIDTYHVFYERAISLTKQAGFIGYITPNTFLRNKHAIELRRLILEETNVEILRLFYYKVFVAASVDTAIGILKKSVAPNKNQNVSVIRSVEADQQNVAVMQPQSVWIEHANKEFSIPSGAGSSELVKRITVSTQPLGDFATAYFGIQTFDRERFVSPTQLNKDYKPAIDGGNIGRYSLLPSVDFVDFRPEAIKSGGKQAVYIAERIGVRQIGEVPIATLVPAGLYSLNTVYNIYMTKDVGYHLLYVLGLLSSRTIQWFWKQSFFDQKQTFPKIKKLAILSVPIPIINFSKPAEKAKHDKMVSLVESMLTLHKDKAAARLGQEKAMLQQQIEATDAQIDRLVYELYGLTEEEIKIVEGAA